MTVGGRIYLKKDNSGLELVKAFAKIPTANIADTMGRSCAMHPRIKLFSSPHGTSMGRNCPYCQISWGR